MANANQFLLSELLLRDKLKTSRVSTCTGIHVHVDLATAVSMRCYSTGSTVLVDLATSTVVYYR